MVHKTLARVFLITCLVLSSRTAFSLDTITVVLPSKAFQFAIFPIAKERGYMKEEGIDLNIVFMQSTPGLQAVLSGEAQFTGSGSSALVAVTKGDAPLKTVLAINNQVLQWLMVRPRYKSLKELNGKKIVVTSVAAIATFMFRQVARKYGLDANSITYLAAGPGERVVALVSGAVDGGLFSTEERYAALDEGMKELMYLGKEVKNSWGTVATTDQFIKEQPKLMTRFMRATLKALRVVRQDRESTVNAVVKFSGLKTRLAERMYDDLIGTFTTNGTVDRETQRNDLDLVRQIVKGAKEVPIERAYDFSFAHRADEQLAQAGWRP